jgi:hypothetical protein
MHLHGETIQDVSYEQAIATSWDTCIKPLRLSSSTQQGSL